MQEAGITMCTQPGFGARIVPTCMEVLDEKLVSYLDRH